MSGSKHRTRLSRATALWLLACVGCSSVGVGDRAATFDGLLRVEPDGERPIDATELSGRPLLIRFWATWCGPCRASMPYLQERHDRLAMRGLTVVAISGEDPATVRAYLAEHHYTFPVAIDPGGEVSKAWGVSFLPSEFLVDGSGEVVSAGFASDEGYAEQLAAGPEPADDVARMRAMLSRRAYLAVADALPGASAESVQLVLGNADLAEFAGAWAPREAALARRAQLAQAIAIGRRADDIDQDRWPELEASGIVTAPHDSAETDPLMGVVLDGYMVSDDTAAFAHRHMRRAVVFEDLARGAAPRSGADREAARRLLDARSAPR